MAKQSNLLNVRDIAENYHDKVLLDTAEILTKSHPILGDLPMMEANNFDAHVTSIRQYLPTAISRKYNQGIPASKSGKTKEVSPIASFDSLYQADKDEITMQPDPAGFLMSESLAFKQALAERAVQGIIYGKDTDSILSLTQKYSTLDKTKKYTAENIIDAGGTGADLTSMWLIAWAANQTLFGVYPRGSQVGLKISQLGSDTALDEDGYEFPALKVHYQWKLGLVTKNYRYAVRIANIKISSLSSTKLTDLMITALRMLPDEVSGNVSIYANRDIVTALDIERVNKGNVVLSLNDFAGQKVLTVRGIPIKKEDGISSTEARVV